MRTPFLTSILPLLLLVSSANSFGWWGPKPTPKPTKICNDHLIGMEPMITPPPFYGRYELAKRQQDVVTAIAGPDNTCGFFGGRPGAPLSCPTTATCLMVKTAAEEVGAIGCCPIGAAYGACFFTFECIDADDFFNSTACNGDCRHDTHTLKCTETSLPYCNSIYWPQESVFNYYCDAVSFNTTQTLFTTFNGEEGREWTTSLLTSPDVITDPVTTTSGDQGGITPPVTIPDLDPTPDPNPQPEEEESSTPVGAIAGGTVGGVAVLALAAGAGFFFWRRNKNKKAAAAAAAATAGGPGGPPPGYSPDQNAAVMAAAAKPPGQGDPNQTAYQHNQYGYGQSPNLGPHEMSQTPVGGYFPQGQQGGYNPNAGYGAAAGGVAYNQYSPNSGAYGGSPQSGHDPRFSTVPSEGGRSPGQGFAEMSGDTGGNRGSQAYGGSPMHGGQAFEVDGGSVRR